MKRIVSGVILLGTVCGCTASDETPPPPSRVVSWTARANPGTPRADGSQAFAVVLRGRIEPGWKLYSLTQQGGGPVPMSVAVEPSPPFELDSAVRGPDPVRATDPNFGISTESYAGEPVFSVGVKVAAGAQAPEELRLRVRSQACSDRLCLPARTETVSVRLSGTGS